MQPETARQGVAMFARIGVVRRPSLWFLSHQKCLSEHHRRIEAGPATPLLLSYYRVAAGMSLLLRHPKRNRKRLGKGKRGHFSFSWGAGLGYHSGRKFESDSIWQKNPLRAGHRAGS
jgi:hypothetical protein